MEENKLTIQEEWLLIKKISVIVNMKILLINILIPF